MKTHSYFIKTGLLLFFLLLFKGNLQAQSQNIIIVNNAVGFPDSTVVIHVDIQNEDPYSDFQFNIPLPDGFSYVLNSVFFNPYNPFVFFNSGVLPNSTTLRVQGFSLNPIFEWVTVSFALYTPSQIGSYPVNPINCIIGNIQGENILTSVTNGIVNIIEIPPFQLGDANCDGLVNVQDIVAIISYILFNNPQPFCFDNADVNQDGLININDVVGTVNIIIRRKSRY